MTVMIRAAVLVDDRRLEIRELPRPTIGRDDGLLRVEASGICGTDVEQYHGAARPLGQPYLAVLGHEPVGVVEEVGDDDARRWGIQGAAYKQALRIIESGRFPLERLRTHTFSLDETETAIRTLAREAPGGEDAVHVVICPGAEADFERPATRL